MLVSRIVEFHYNSVDEETAFNREIREIREHGIISVTSGSRDYSAFLADRCHVTTQPKDVAFPGCQGFMLATDYLAQFLDGLGRYS